jgi:methylated-DNA-[protein]-cysteine S-methyltransferase
MDSALLTSPIGPLYVEGENGKLTRLYTDGHRFHAHAEPDHDGRFADLQAQLDEYFAGERTTFDIPLAQHGTDFELRVWERLREIPYGETCTYGEIARELSSSARAVGRANGRNQISIIVPCHRVVGANGSLTGYAGGLEAKRALLDHELGAGRLSEPPGVAI